MAVRRQKIKDPEQLVNLFLKRYEEMWKSSVIQKGFDLSLNFHSDFIKNETTINLKQPDEENLRAFLTHFRKFIAMESDFNLHKIYNICQVHITDVDCRHHLAESRKSFSEIRTKNRRINISISNKNYTSEEIAQLWINGVIFHDDPEDVALLESLDPFLFSICRFVFIDFVIETSMLIRYVANELNLAKKKGWLQF